MSETYRGYPIPEIIHVEPYYWIVDDRFGEHKGYKPEVALSFWKLRVDTDIILDAIEMGLIERWVEPEYEKVGCLECGLVIYDVALHLNWHRSH